ncbi:hypothetical protein D7B24_001524 [Verticillium nonalfalfae]|uniref:Major facilitator superfamily (MFS) profile domain-containing protein n=1 Tax=Verticillium nonalfalfae TaxID=1051616 RepID=A0A3M9YHY6_9PEZI|nr:uncharacterized protein D7B24_001524 [Verticillium nonalfalfae]RNJ59795.1 hypothetical protein D7B24_001524 [Verticillium nonalfalfae]
MMSRCSGDGSASRRAESSPLLGNRATDGSCSSYNPAGYDTNEAESFQPSAPLLKKQVLLLCYARLMEPLAFFSIFPYVAEMVQRNGNLAESDVGFYSGLVEAAFSAAQAVTLLLWGTLADRFGRRSMLLYSLAGMATGTALFGTASEIWHMILFRSLTGLFSGANLIIRTMIGELCTPDSQATFFSWYAVAGNLGIFIGPIIGGALADPASQYPSVFGDSAFLQRHPYALSGFATAAMTGTAVLITAVAIQETLPEQAGNSLSKACQIAQQESPQPSMRQILQTTQVQAVLGSYAYVMFIAIAFMAIHPVVLYTPVHHGGLGLSTTQITAFIAAVGASETVWLMIAFPLLQRRVGTKRVLVVCSWLWPLFFAGYTVTSALEREGQTIAAVVVAVFNIVVGPGAFMAFTAVQLAVNEASPSPGVLGKLNSSVEILSSIIRSVVPGIATAVFAVGARGNILGGYLAWVVLIVSTMGLPLILKRFPDDHVRC